MTPDSTPRFAFGKNWSGYLDLVDEHRIAAAESSLQALLKVQRLDGVRFLDVGCGSGLLSLAARRLGATVRSFDFDPDAVSCAERLRARYCAGTTEWIIDRGSALDEQFMTSLGEADVVYAWGVLHHTGEMWRALAHTASRVAPGGRLAIALYNDQGRASRRWAVVKRAYVRGGSLIRGVLLAMTGAWLVARAIAGRLDRLITPGSESRTLSIQSPARGMSRWYDLVDWVGGYPFEVAAPGEVLDFARSRDLVLESLVTVGNDHGNNQFVFRRSA